MVRVSALCPGANLIAGYGLTMALIWSFVLPRVESWAFRQQGARQMSIRKSNCFIFCTLSEGRIFFGFGWDRRQDTPLQPHISFAPPLKRGTKKHPIQ